MQYACMGGETGCARAQHSRRSDGQKRCCIIFGNVFFFLSNTLIKNENYSLEFSTQSESVGFRFYAKILLKETMYKIMIFRSLKNLKCSCDGRQEGIYFMTFGSFLLIRILICGVQYSRDRQCLR